MILRKMTLRHSVENHQRSKKQSNYSDQKCKSRWQIRVKLFRLEIKSWPKPGKGSSSKHECIVRFAWFIDCRAVEASQVRDGVRSLGFFSTLALSSFSSLSFSSFSVLALAAFVALVSFLALSDRLSHPFGSLLADFLSDFLSWLVSEVYESLDLFGSELLLDLLLNILPGLAIHLFSGFLGLLNDAIA